MKPYFDSNNLCPNCKRHCPKSNLQCSRGIEYFRQENEIQTKKSQHKNVRNIDSIKDETVILMMQCGHILHHRVRESEINQDFLFFLSQDEKSELTRLLKKCIEKWNN